MAMAVFFYYPCGEVDDVVAYTFHSFPLVGIGGCLVENLVDECLHNIHHLTNVSNLRHLLTTFNSHKCHQVTLSIVPRCSRLCGINGNLILTKSIIEQYLRHLWLLLIVWWLFILVAHIKFVRALQQVMSP